AGCGDLAGHDGADRAGDDIRPGAVQVAHDVSFADDARDVVAVRAHDDGADAALVQDLEEVCDRVVRADGDDTLPLVAQHVRDLHDRTVVQPRDPAPD